MNRRLSKHVAAVLCIVLLTAGIAGAQSMPASAPASGPLVGTGGGRVGTDNASPFSGLWQTIVALAVVVGLIFAIRYAARRLGSGPSGASGERIEILSRQGLTGRHQVMLLRVSGRELLVGVSPESVTLLAEMDADDGNLPDAPEADHEDSKDE